MIQNTPYFIDLKKEYFEEKKILDKWHETNCYCQIINSEPYPKEHLYNMIDLLEIMDNMYTYAPPNGFHYKECLRNFEKTIRFFYSEGEHSYYEGHHQNVESHSNIHQKL